MKLFLHAELIHWQQSTYEKPWLSYATALSDEITGAEVDSQSEDSYVDLIIRLCKEAKVICVVVQTGSEPLGRLLKLFHSLLREEHKINSIILTGSHASLERLFQSLGDRFIRESDPEKIKLKIQQFASA
jgi:Tfp pilus assembly PilM family ATPase